MTTSRPAGWQKLVEGYPWFEGEGRYPIPAYSEFMPAPSVGCSPYGGDVDKTLFAEDDVYGWRLPEIEEEHELQPGLAQDFARVYDHVARLLDEHAFPHAVVGALGLHAYGHSRATFDLGPGDGPGGAAFAREGAGAARVRDPARLGGILEPPAR